LFFSASGCKRPGYVLPALPPLALALGCYFDVLVPRFATLRAPDWAVLASWGSRGAYRATLVVLALGLAAAVLAGSRQMVRPGTGLLLSVVAGVALVAIWRRRTVSWGACSLTTFAVLFAGVLQLHAGYNRQFALRGRLRSDDHLARSSGLPVVCYPQRWDSVSFYLPRADVRVFSADQHRELAEELRSRPRTLVVVKSGPALRELLSALPASAEFEPRGRPGAVTAGWVRLRPEVAPFQVASR
jgi:hypothetical protein